ncbi:MAG: glycerophosphodiester phosphodiesterase [Candidatus Staskawiczbacteria bacterium]|nr:glycerophosphodiester phosphodiesterase [Candidatus Staskawiczbacteria bacterium]
MIKIGHRGAAGYEVENTAKALKKALELRVNIIEMDVRRCATGELVVFHDKKIDRITNGRGLIRKLSLAEIKKLRTFDGQKILTLSEALEIINGSCMVNLHLKAKNIARPLIDLLHQMIATKQWTIRQFLISSFNTKDLYSIKKLDNKIKVGILYYRHILSIVRRAKKISAYSVHIHSHLLSQKLISALHQNNIQVFVWTLNRTADIKHARQLKVDGIISDFPDLI